MRKFGKRLKSLFSLSRVKALALTMLVSTVTFAQNAAGDYTAGTNALSTVAEENAFGLNHTRAKYD